MDFPLCNNCQADNWIKISGRSEGSNTIDIYKCSSCEILMSWSYTKPEDELVRENKYTD